MSKCIASKMEQLVVVIKVNLCQRYHSRNRDMVQGIHTRMEMVRKRLHQLSIKCEEVCFIFFNHHFNFFFRFLDSICTFCDWTCNDASALDRHYWKNCPILTKCPQCSLILEIAALNSHLISKFFKRCFFINFDKNLMKILFGIIFLNFFIRYL